MRLRPKPSITSLPHPPTPAGAGFTLVEVLMAMTVVVIGLIGMMQAVALGTETLDTTRKQQVAMQLVEAEIQRLRAGAWTTIANLPATATITINSAGAISGDAANFALSNFTAAASDDNTALSALGAGFKVSLAATRLRPTAATAGTVTFVKLDYTVSWTSNTGRKHARRLATYLGQNGLHLSYQQS